MENKKVPYKISLEERKQVDYREDETDQERAAYISSLLKSPWFCPRRILGRAY